MDLQSGKLKELSKLYALAKQSTDPVAKAEYQHEFSIIFQEVHGKKVDKI